MPKQDYLENWMAIYYYLLALNIYQFSPRITLRTKISKLYKIPRRPAFILKK